MKPRVLALAALLATACGGDNPMGGTGGTAPLIEAPSTSTSKTTTSGVEIDLAGMRAEACGDATFYLVDPDGTGLVTIVIPDLAARAHEASGPTTETFEAGQPGITISMQTGTHLEQMVCNDAIEAEPVVETEAAATSGTVAVTTVARYGGDSPIGENLAESDLTVAGLRFGDVTSPAEPITFGDLLIGWFVG